MPEQTEARVATRHSILYADPNRAELAALLEIPKCFPDLLLDRITTRITQGREDYQLLPFFFDHLSMKSDITLRHEVWKDLENRTVTSGLRFFVKEMKEVRQRLSWAKKTRYVQHRRGIQLDAVLRYCAAVEHLTTALNPDDITSPALIEFRKLATAYAETPTYQNLARDSQQLGSQTPEIRYSINVLGPRVRVLRYEGEADYGSEIEEAFARFSKAK